VALALDVAGRTVARVPVEEHMANYRAARALLCKGRNAVKERPRFPVTDCGSKRPGFPRAAPKRTPRRPR
jgi:hypothetical protein